MTSDYADTLEKVSLQMVLKLYGKYHVRLYRLTGKGKSHV